MQGRCSILQGFTGRLTHFLVGTSNRLPYRRLHATNQQGWPLNVTSTQSRPEVTTTANCHCCWLATAPNTSPSEADRRKLQELELALAKAKRELEVFCMETNQTSSLLPVEDATQDNVQEHPAPECDTDKCCQHCGSLYESEPVAQSEPRRNIPPSASCVITRVLNAAPQLQTRYTNTTTGGSNNGEWHVGSPEGGFMGAQISGSIEVLADRVREDWGCKRVFFKVFGDCPEEFNRVLMNHTQKRQIHNSGYDVDTGELAL
ncbi:hypothetical protein BFJ72_g2567 [Fusarium proliferatum]|uniref:Uncharacterized protein n=1 Tax=Gibberella intermedia TaxID=948311 RepID=A0A420TZ83_GIBIN|nr:hypothetical protein BFJ72_g2567 [Fusarium proliferatum]